MKPDVSTNSLDDVLGKKASEQLKTSKLSGLIRTGKYSLICYYVY